MVKHYGKPGIKNTRIPVSLILGYLAAGSSIDEIISDFPDLKHDDIIACLQYARDLWHGTWRKNKIKKLRALVSPFLILMFMNHLETEKDLIINDTKYKNG